MLESSDKLVPEALHAVPKTAPMHSHAPPCYIPYRSPSAQELMGARWKVMGPHVLPYHPTAPHNAPSSSRVCRSHGPWADMGWHGCCMVRYGRPWACMGPHGSSDGNSPFSECMHWPALTDWQFLLACRRVNSAMYAAQGLWTACVCSKVCKRRELLSGLKVICIFQHKSKLHTRYTRHTRLALGQYKQAPLHQRHKRWE